MATALERFKVTISHNIRQYQLKHTHNNSENRVNSENSENMMEKCKHNCFPVTGEYIFEDIRSKFQNRHVDFKLVTDGTRTDFVQFTHTSYVKTCIRGCQKYI